MPVKCDKILIRRIGTYIAQFFFFFFLRQSIRINFCTFFSNISEQSLKYIRRKVYLLACIMRARE